MLSNLVKLADILTSYARGGAPGSIPKVHVNFTCDPTDIDVDGWVLKLVLEGFDKLDDLGHVVPNYEKAWEVTGSSPNECVIRVFAKVRDFLRSELDIKILESSAVEGALKYLESDSNPEELPNLWPQTKAQAGELEDQAENGDGWTEAKVTTPMDDLLNLTPKDRGFIVSD